MQGARAASVFELEKQVAQLVCVGGQGWPVTLLDGAKVGTGANAGLPGPVYAKLYAAYQQAKIQAQAQAQAKEQTT